jgi:hypothetical protein
MSRITAALTCVTVCHGINNEEVSSNKPAAYQQGGLCSAIRFHFIFCVEAVHNLLR